MTIFRILSVLLMANLVDLTATTKNIKGNEKTEILAIKVDFNVDYCFYKADPQNTFEKDIEEMVDEINFKLLNDYEIMILPQITKSDFVFNEPCFNIF
ncbi:hypothetical protein MHBO_002955 [Bonamia ostreae]|uniref:Uncharacterized protein n=1 Tax=Bonamia ostreae TaxID=126728 RepID=A0ABV2AP17_9EUKA